MDQTAPVEIIENVEQFIDEFYSMNQKPKKYISDYFDKVRNGIDVERERIIMGAHSASKQMIDESNKLENECYENMDDNIDKLCEKNYLFLEGVDDKISRLKDELRVMKLVDNEKRKCEILEEVTKTHQQAKAEMVNFEGSLLCDKGVIFHPKGNSFKALDLGLFRVDTPVLIESIKQLGDLCTSSVFEPNYENEADLQQAKDLVKLCELEDKRFSLKYRATQDGFGTQEMYEACKDAIKTLMVIRSANNNIFGGYIEQEWTIPQDFVYEFKSDKNAFLFSLVNEDKKPIKMACADESEAVEMLTYGISFGSADLVIMDHPNIDLNCWSILGSSYKHPSYEWNTTDSNEFLAGSEYFTIQELEIYEVLDQE